MQGCFRPNKNKNEMSGTRFVTVTPLQLSENPKKYVPEEATVNNIMRTFGRLQSMTEMTNSAGTGKLYEVRLLETETVLVRPSETRYLLSVASHI